MESRRVDIKKILADPVLRRELTIRAAIAIQAREGIDRTYEQMAEVYDEIHRAGIAQKEE